MHTPVQRLDVDADAASAEPLKESDFYREADA